MTSTQRRRVAALACAAGLVLALSIPPTATSAQPGLGSFSVTARADLFLVQVFDERAPLLPAGQALVELSPATAQAAIDSLGSSTAFAGAPFPGETVVGLPGLIGGAGGGEVPPLPSLPFVVSSAHPTDEGDEVEGGAYRLSARSDATSSRGVASLSAGEEDTVLAATGRADSQVAVGEDRVTATSQVRGAGLALPDVLEVADLRSSTTVSVGVEDEVTATTSFEVGVLSVAGVQLVVDADGVRLEDEVVPLEGSALTELLAPAGVELTFLPEEIGQSEDGATFARSAGLLVETEFEGPDGLRDRVVVELGRTFATVDARPAGVAEFPDPPAGDPEPPGSVDDAGGLDGAEQAEGFEPPADVGALDAAPAASTPDLDAPVPAPEVAEEQDLVAVPAMGPLVPGPTLSGFYLLLLTAGFVTVGASRLVGELGIRSRGAPVPRARP